MATLVHMYRLHIFIPPEARSKAIKRSGLIYAWKLHGLSGKNAFFPTLDECRCFCSSALRFCNSFTFCTSSLSFSRTSRLRGCGGCLVVGGSSLTTRVSSLLLPSSPFLPSSLLTFSPMTVTGEGMAWASSLAIFSTEEDSLRAA